MSQKTGAERCFSRRLRPIGQAILGADIEPLVRDVCRRIRTIRNSTQAGAFVLADAEGFVYVLQELSPTAAKTIRKEAEILVGFYAGRPTPSDDELKMDLIAHFFDVGFLKPGMVYGQVERES